MSFPHIHFPTLHFSSDFGGDPVKPDEYPQWVDPHESRIVRDEHGVSVLGFHNLNFPEAARVHVQRGTHKVTVLVHDVAEHRVAFMPWEGNPQAEPGLVIDPAVAKYMDPDPSFAPKEAFEGVKDAD